jgi:hypothetical protein
VSTPKEATNTFNTHSFDVLFWREAAKKIRTETRNSVEKLNL